MKYDVFISYSSRNHDVANAICHVLEENMLKCWMAPRDIPVGSKYASVIKDAIVASKVFVLVFSEYAAVSPWVESELNIAFSNRKTIIPYKVDKAFVEDYDEFYVRLNNRHWIDSFPDFHERFNELIQVVSANVFVKSPVHTSQKPLTPKPVEPKQLKPADISKVNTSSHIKSGFLCPCGSGRLYRDCHGGPSMHYMVDSPRPHPVDRVWQVGDYYNYDGKEGVVFWVDESRKHGKIISMDHSNLQWCIKKENEKGVVTNANNRKNGKRNGQFIISIDDWKNKYPAFLWCLNHGDDWYLPAIEELEELLLNKEVHARVNKTLKERNATQLFDRGQGYFYWSSTEEGLWGAWAIDLSFGFSFHYRRRGKCYVRAVSAF